VAWLAAGPLAARAATPLPAGPGLQAVPEDWRPPVAQQGALDWLRLSKGEWVAGSLERISDDVVYFDSNEFDDVEIDLEDVLELRSARHHTYRLEGATPRDDILLTGTAGMRAGSLRIEADGELHVFERTRLIGMVEGGLRERDYWSGEVSLGVTANSGNSDQTDLSTYAMIRRETALTRGQLSYRASQSTSDGKRTAESHRANGEFDYYLTRRLFLVAPWLEAFGDPFQNIKLRSTAGVGLGYDVIDTAKWEWEVGTGLAYQSNELDTAPAGESTTANDVAVQFNTELKWEPTSNIEYTTSYRIQLVATDPGNTNHHLSSVLEFDIWGPLELDITWIWDRIWQPGRDENGVRPASDDYRFVVGLSLDF
jgi:putative salt-induced outer membrane protein YdiY